MIKKIALFVAVMGCLMTVVALGAAQEKAMKLPPIEHMQNYTVKLSSNATTGYAWFIKSYDSNLLVLQSHRYVAPKTLRVGAGGYEIWVFAPTHALKAPHVIPVTFVYARSWELKSGTAKNLQTKTVNIVTQ
ncbi:MAG: hypothetical protein A3C55_06110 [Gammaproteobacteria bacterium RIFCSPHIGHO2_02_FULL_42_13]|nr:MAG: hypothetical protein A3C55_06110 [Gammaproteobacteria bacterium RIFCSPHIGHO2_02_FULL_42_13]OGT67723.1 MAG: hypothetical protein A3H43_04440 [Gammaproteobacteria bacterium RIFCSPLOWO2_02_FULL_42_9]